MIISIPDFFPVPGRHHVGWRAIVPFVEALISGRYSQKILKKMENMAL
ncbi:MAG: hypothetical protein J7K96_00785 [Desulfobacteraceae bacterium]|nr:hypothetical protein [Desulfobacteraceae bacterium]